MTRYVVDASVVVKWLVWEDLSESARALATPSNNLYAPDFVLVEVGNALWRKVVADSLTEAHASALLVRLSGSHVGLASSGALLTDAFTLAVETKRTVYDSLYLALAREIDAPLVTADLRFRNALTSSSYGGNVVWLGDLTPA